MWPFKRKRQPVAVLVCGVCGATAALYRKRDAESADIKPAIGWSISTEETWNPYVRTRRVRCPAHAEELT